MTAPSKRCRASVSEWLLSAIQRPWLPLWSGFIGSLPFMTIAVWMNVESFDIRAAILIVILCLAIGLNFTGVVALWLPIPGYRRLWRASILVTSCLAIMIGVLSWRSLSADLQESPFVVSVVWLITGLVVNSCILGALRLLAAVTVQMVPQLREIAINWEVPQ